MVHPGPFPLSTHSVDLGLYDQGFRALGCDVVTVCRSGLDTGVTYPVTVVPTEAAWADPAFWTQFDAQVALIVTWHRYTSIIVALRQAGVQVVAIADSDGRVSPRFHPWCQLELSVYRHPTWRLRVQDAKVWTQRVLIGASAEHRALVENTAACDLVTLASEGPMREFQRLLGRLGAKTLASRVVWLPYPVPESFCTSPVAADHPDRVIAVGRWDSLQKNARLLVATSRRLAASGSRTELIIVGPAADRFTALTRTFPGVRVVGPQGRDCVRELMAECRAVLVPSRFESGPLVAYEMLALGGTVVGTPIPSLIGITADGRFGRVARSRRAHDMAAALHAEAAAWNAGERDPAAIAGHWRELLRPEQVARRALDLLGVPRRGIQ
jgi:glycosyltransferase involved in cell wall biosynthesis